MVVTERPVGRQLMVLDDAETIARQARRRAALRRRRREALQRLGVFSLVAALTAAIAGVPLLVVGAVWLVAASGLGLAYHHAREHQQHLRRRRSRAVPGPGIGAPRPKGGFSTTRHRSGAPVWVDRHDAA